jgi:hypothetical protein
MRHLFCLFLPALLAGCQREDAPPPPPPESSVTPLQVDARQLRSLVWLEGMWRGTQSDTAPFFERYRYLDDSTIGTWTYADSLGTQVVDSGSIRLRSGIVTSGDSARGYVLTALDSSSAHFEPRGAAVNAFTWRRMSESSWSATLTWRDAAGQPIERIYVMRLLSR